MNILSIAMLISFGSCLFILTLVLSVLAETPISSANEIEIFSPDSKPYNQTYADWTVKWWRWIESIPAPINPLTDKDGKLCGTSQHDQHVWFLAGTVGNQASRTCEIPAGKAIMFPIINVICHTFTDRVYGEDLLKCAEADQNHVNSKKLMIDGNPIENLDGFRIHSPLFNITLPEQNTAGTQAGTTQAASDGWFVILKPLPPGVHNITRLWECILSSRCRKPGN